jgi:hypothetical protein
LAAALASGTAIAQEAQPPAVSPPATEEQQGQPAVPTPRSDVQVTTWVSRTALYVGDPVDYLVELTTAPRIEVLSEDLAQDKIKLDGLVLLSADRERESRSDGSAVHRFRFRVTTYTTEPQPLRISSSAVRYYQLRPGERPEDARPSGEVRVPGIVLARRSTMPDEITSLTLRDRGGLMSAAPLGGLAGLIGFGLVLAAAAPVAMWGAARIRESRTRVKRPSVRVARSHARAAFEGLHGLDVATPNGRLDAFGRLEAALRQHVVERYGLPAHALPAREMAVRLDPEGAVQVPGGIVELVAECERTRYGPADRLPPPERFAAALAAAEQAVQEARS